MAAKRLVRLARVHRQLMRHMTHFEQRQFHTAVMSAYAAGMHKLLSNFLVRIRIGRHFCAEMHCLGSCNAVSQTGTVGQAG